MEGTEGGGDRTDLFHQLFSLAMLAPVILGHVCDTAGRETYTHDSREIYSNLYKRKPSWSTGPQVQMGQEWRSDKAGRGQGG